MAYALAYFNALGPFDALCASALFGFACVGLVLFCALCARQVVDASSCLVGLDEEIVELRLRLRGEEV